MNVDVELGRRAVGRGVGAVPDLAARGRRRGRTWARPTRVTPYATTWDTTTFTDGLYDLRVITTDNVGNAFTSADDRRACGSTTRRRPGCAHRTRRPTRSSAARSRMTHRLGRRRARRVTSVQFQRSPAGTNTWTNVGAADTTAPYAATLDHDDGHDRRPLRPPRGHHRQGRQHVHLGARHEPPRRQHRAHRRRHGTRGGGERARQRGRRHLELGRRRVGRGVGRSSRSSHGGAATWSNLGAADTASPYATTWDTTAFTDGLYDLRVVTTDDAGNATTSARSPASGSTTPRRRGRSPLPRRRRTSRAPSRSPRVRPTRAPASHRAVPELHRAARTRGRTSPRPTRRRRTRRAGSRPATPPGSTTCGSSPPTRPATRSRRPSPRTCWSTTPRPTVTLDRHRGRPARSRAGRRSTSRANAAGRSRLVATVTDAGSGAGVGDLPGAGHRRMDARRRGRHDPGRGSVHLECLLVDERRDRARHLHGDGRGCRGEHRDERVDVHRRRRPRRRGR